MNILFCLLTLRIFIYLKILILSYDDENSVFFNQKKDVLEDLLQQSKINYTNIMKKREG